MKPLIYLDYAATTPVDTRVFECMLPYLKCDGMYANPSSAHAFGKAVKGEIEQAREEVADLIGAKPDEIIWTSGATEANNLAIKGAASLYQNKGKHIITLQTEHLSVLDSCQSLEKLGHSITYLHTDANGLIDLTALKSAIRQDTVLVSIMHVNNETGVVQNIEKCAEIIKENNLLFHIDAVQSAGKIDLNMQKVPADLVSLSAHKLYGPKGAGALYIRRIPRVRLAAQLHGGGQEWGMRSGTLATHQIVGMGAACQLVKKNRQEEYKKIEGLRERFLQVLGPYVHTIHGAKAPHVPHILNIAFPMPAEALLHHVPEIAFSLGSACKSREKGHSHVLRAMGAPLECAQRSVRFSFGRYTTLGHVEDAGLRIGSVLALWR